MDVKISRITTTGSDQTVTTGPAKLLGIKMESAGDFILKDGSTTRMSLTGWDGSLDFKGAQFTTSLVVNLSAGSCVVLWS